MNVNLDASKVKGFKFEPSHYKFFLLGSWIAEAVALILLVCSAVVWDYPLDVPTIALWVLAVAVVLPEFLVTFKMEDDFKKWQIHTVFTFVILALFSVAMVMWIAAGHDSSDKDMFFGVIGMAKYVVIVWAVYTVINLVAFLTVLIPVLKTATPAAVPEAAEAEAPVAVPADMPAGYRQNMDTVLRDIDRFSAPVSHNYGLAEKRNKGGN